VRRKKCVGVCTSGLTEQQRHLCLAPLRGM
jgi:hypothetical protein